MLFLMVRPEYFVENVPTEGIVLATPDLMSRIECFMTGTGTTENIGQGSSAAVDESVKILVIE